VTNTLSDDATEGRGYVWDLSIFRVNKSLYAHAKAVWEANHFVLVSCNSTSFFYQFQQYEIPTAAPYFVSWMVEDRKHKLKCHLHIDIDVDDTHISEIAKQDWDPKRFHIFDLDEDEAADRAPIDVPLPPVSRFFFVLCHQDLPDFVRALREIDIAFACHPKLNFDMQTLSSGATLPLRKQRLLLDPFRHIRSPAERCTLSGAVETSLAEEFMAHLTSTVTWTSAAASSDIFYLTSRALEQANKDFLQGNIACAARTLDEAAGHWQTLKQTLPSMFNDKSESGMVEGLLYALSANQARLNLEKTVRGTDLEEPQITRRDPSHEAGIRQGRFGDLREFMWSIEAFGNAQHDLAVEGFGRLAAEDWGYGYILGHNISRQWHYRSSDTEENVMLQAHAQGLSLEKWQETLERRSRHEYVLRLVELLPEHLCRPVFKDTVEFPF